MLACFECESDRLTHYRENLQKNFNHPLTFWAKTHIT